MVQGNYHIKISNRKVSDQLHKSYYFKRERERENKEYNNILTDNESISERSKLEPTISK